MILVSSCLVGLEVRYDGTHCLHSQINKLVKEEQAISVCPELLAGFSVPREPTEIVGGEGGDVLDGKARVVTKSGTDVTNLYIKGAYRTLEKAQELRATLVVLKETSPSCGNSMIYNGEFSGEKVVGNGVTSALLKRHGYSVISEEQFLESLKDQTT
ncbi:DUF523 domain-containing protein [Anaerobacillus alkaliphilus]|uniref:DUF523 domain-containing protein n=1 Tax=Anaerobacillus alkaliphilus TaxID=1548597 RepID=A0A4Q0W1M9_9BACI|nr:DUF523 domain-containing protein [Anaerobacillus alkaliphilus]RXJ04491.1 DUF523 domain-containing protein [Anaerobacillus alkaliphilus]